MSEWTLAFVDMTFIFAIHLAYVRNASIINIKYLCLWYRWQFLSSPNKMKRYVFVASVQSTS